MFADHLLRLPQLRADGISCSPHIPLAPMFVLAVVRFTAYKRLVDSSVVLSSIFGRWPYSGLIMARVF
jgi:hypothetical protein